MKPFRSLKPSVRLRQRDGELSSADSARAQKELAAISKPDYGRVRDAVITLAENPRPSNCKKLVGREGWRIRVGDYRVI